MADSKIRPWDRQEKESPEYFAMFEMYLRERNIPYVIRTLYPGGGMTERDYVNKISQRYQWKKRADAYDRWIAKQRDDAIKAQVQQETKIITEYRIELITDVVKKVKRFGKQLDKIFVDEKSAEIPQLESEAKRGASKTLEKTHVGLVKGYVEMVKMTDDLMRGFVKDNPAQESADAPMTAEKQSAQARLEAFIKKREDAARIDAERLSKTAAKPSGEMIQ